MTMYAALKTEADPKAAVRGLLEKMLAENLADAVLVPAASPYSDLPMPTLFTHPESMVRIDPLAPVAPFNAARQAAAVLRHNTQRKVAVVLRPCEIRALIELAKLKQCTLDNAVILGVECLGRLENNDFLEEIGKNPGFTSAFYQQQALQERVCKSCRTCTHFQPMNADIVIALAGMDLTQEMGIFAHTETGKEIAAGLGLAQAEEPLKHADVLAEMLRKRTENQDALFRETREKISSMAKFQNVIANCLNCYNCRVACPVCYCKACVFVTDVFAPEPETLLRRAGKPHGVKLPCDTTMFHMTRLAHISHACVGCGQCSSVCPSSIPVADIFKTIAAQTQELFDYLPGRDLSEPIPYMVFEEKAS